MPYIKKEERKPFDPILDVLILELKKYPGSGNVNYVITRLIDAIYSDKNYESYNSAMGVLVGVLIELYRQKIAPYEDKKQEANGDVYH